MDEQIGRRRSLVGDGVYELASTLAVTTLGKQAVLMERVDWSVGQQHRRLHGARIAGLKTLVVPLVPELHSCTSDQNYIDISPCRFRFPWER